MRIPVVFLILLFVAAVGCGGDGDQTPAQVVEAYQKALAAEDYTGAEQYLSEGAKQQMISSAGSVDAGIRQAAEPGKVQRVEVLLKQTLSGGLTTLDVVYHYENGESAEDTVSLLREGGKYKLLARQ